MENKINETNIKKPVMKNNDNKKNKKTKNLKLNKNKLFYGVSGVAIGVLTITSIAIPTSINNNKNKEISKLKTEFSGSSSTYEKNIKQLKEQKTKLTNEMNQKIKNVEDKVKKLDAEKKTLENNYKNIMPNSFTGHLINGIAFRDFFDAAGTLKGKQTWEYKYPKDSPSFHTWSGVKITYPQGKTTLSKILLPRVVEIGDWNVFQDTHIREIILPNVKTLADYTFTGTNPTYGITSETIKLDNVEIIGKGAFQGAYLLKELNLKRARSIGAHAFRYCELLKVLDVSKWSDNKNMEKAKDVFKDIGSKEPNKTTRIILNRSVASFSNLESLKKIWFGGAVPSYIKFEFK